MSPSLLSVSIIFFALLTLCNYENVLAGRDHKTKEQANKEQSTLDNIKKFGDKFATWCLTILDGQNDWYQILPLFSKPTIFNEKSEIEEVDNLVKSILDFLYEIRDTLVTNGNIHALIATWKPRDISVEESYENDVGYLEDNDFGYKRRKRNIRMDFDRHDMFDAADAISTKKLLEQEAQRSKVIIQFNPRRENYPSRMFAWEEAKTVEESRIYLVTAVRAVAEFLQDQARKVDLPKRALGEIAGELVMANEEKRYNRKPQNRKISGSLDEGLLIFVLEAKIKALEKGNGTGKFIKNQQEHDQNDGTESDDGVEKDDQKKLITKCTLILQVLKHNNKANNRVAALEVQLSKALGGQGKVFRNAKKGMARIGDVSMVRPNDRIGYQKPKRNGRVNGKGGKRRAA